MLGWRTAAAICKALGPNFRNTHECSSVKSTGMLVFLFAEAETDQQCLFVRCELRVALVGPQQR